MPRNARTIILTASVAAITATGAWYGAGLKTQQEYHQVSRPSSPYQPSPSQTDYLSGKTINTSISSIRKNLLTGSNKTETAIATRRTTDQDRSIELFEFGDWIDRAAGQTCCAREDRTMSIVTMRASYLDVSMRPTLIEDVKFFCSQEMPASTTDLRHKCLPYEMLCPS